MNASPFAVTVQKRAVQRCEYCRMHQSLQGATFHVEHIRPASRGGASSLENLAWCCPSCNLHKSDRSQTADPDTSQLAPLFHPRQDDWNDHFVWLGYYLTGRTACGRATIAALKLNTERRLLIRRAEEQFKLFPPT
jgi:HNH endonuclease